jgi:alkanesulfonate monooxygenase SsuD/methylene tetrahydromethanopterin reductase-like flavin-dependent oxidoreductase (luciferase family)
VTKPFHLGWFTNFAPPIWESPFSGDVGSTWTDGQFYVEVARALDRAGFDYMMLEDSSLVADTFEGSSRADLKHHIDSPKQDPLMLAPLLAKATEHLGIIMTAAASLYPPQLLAKNMATLARLSGGRVGWNIVTGSNHRAAQNYGLDGLADHDDRYDRADEYVGTVTSLWEGWTPKALAGATRPVFCQAGGSPRGREFAARYADTIVTQARGVDRMKAFRDDIRARMSAIGRDPDSCKLLFLTSPILGETDDEARDLQQAQYQRRLDDVERTLANMSNLTGIDFSTFELDEAIPGVETNGHRTTLDEFVRLGENGTKTLRQVAAGWNIDAVDLVGSVDTVATMMGDVMEEVGGDGFLLYGPATLQYVTDVTDGLVPELRRRGLTRPAYSHSRLRENLTAF